MTRDEAAHLRVLVSAALAKITEKEQHLDMVDDAEDKLTGSPITRLIDHAMAVSWVLGVLDAAESLWLIGLDEEASAIARLVSKRVEELYETFSET